MPKAKLVIVLVFLLPLLLFSQEQDAFLQSQFDLAISVINQQPEFAAEILEGIYSVNPTIRLELEIGRAYFIARNFNESRKWFVGALNKDLPPFVRANVENYLTQIRNQESPFDYSLGIIKDSNPMASTSAQTINLFGIFDVPYNNKYEIRDEYGVEVNASYQDSYKKFGFGGILSHTQFESNDFRRGYVIPYISYNGFISPKFNFRVSFPSEYFGDDSLRSSKQFNLDYFLGFYNRWRIKLNFQYEENNYEKYFFLDGISKRLNINYSRWLNQNYEISGSHTIYSQDALDSQFAFEGVQHQLRLHSNNFLDSFEYEIAYTWSDRDYEGINPILPVHRLDETQTLSILIEKQNLYIFGAKPILRLTHQINDSTLNINEYSKYYFSFNFERYL